MVVAPGRYVECAVVKSGRFAIRAVISGSVTFDGRACQNKAAFVIKGSWVDVGGLRFCNVRVPDRNGAGLRIQGGDVTVRLTTFEDGENGILTNMDPIGTPSFERSIFRRLGFCPPDRNCAHSIYAGKIAHAEIRDSLFEQGRGGHYVKLRVREVAFADNLVDDNAGNGASYLLELPNGAAGQVSGNAFINGPKAENRCRAMVVGAEGIEQDSTVAARNNRAFNLSERPVIILADLSGDVRESGNATDGWFVRRTGFAVKDRCVGCFLLRRLSEPRSGVRGWGGRGDAGSGLLGAGQSWKPRG